MRKIPAIAAREIKSYFVQPIAYVAIVVFLAILTAAFVLVLNKYMTVLLSINRMNQQNLSVTDDVIRTFFGQWLLSAIWVIVPLVTMRLLAEERRAGTAELLLTAPVSTLELVVGKFLGAMGVLVVMFALTLHFPFYILTTSTPDANVIGTIYLGVILVAGVLVAIGLLASALTENQIVAALLCLVFAMSFLLIGFLARVLPAKAGDIVSTFSVMDNYNEFVKGVLDTRAIFFFVSATAFFIFLTQRILDSQRWR